MALLAPGSVLWQTTSWSHYNWNDFPPELNRDTEQRFQAWLGTDNDPQWLEFPYIYGRTGVSYVINFDRMEQQRVGVKENDPPRPVRRQVVTNEGRVAVEQRRQNSGPTLNKFADWISFE